MDDDDNDDMDDNDDDDEKNVVGGGGHDVIVVVVIMMIMMAIKGRCTRVNGSSAIWVELRRNLSLLGMMVPAFWNAGMLSSEASSEWNFPPT